MSQTREIGQVQTNSRELIEQGSFLFIVADNDAYKHPNGQPNLTQKRDCLRVLKTQAGTQTAKTVTIKSSKGEVIDEKLHLPPES